MAVATDAKTPAAAGLPPDERVAECTDRDGIVLSVNGHAVSPASDGIRRGHEVDG